MSATGPGRGAERGPADGRAHARGSPSMTRSIAQVVVIKDEDLFLVVEPDGGIPLSDRHGLGLYYHDCRYLNGYELRLADDEPLAVLATAGPGFQARIELTNLAIAMAGGGEVRKESLGIRWSRTIDYRRRALHDRIRFRNDAHEPARFPVALRFRAEFEDLFEVRGAGSGRRGRLRRPEWDGDVLRFAYDGADGVVRSLSIHLAPAPQSRAEDGAEFRLELQPGESREVLATLAVAERPAAGGDGPGEPGPPDPAGIEAALHRSTEEWLGRHTEVAGDDRDLVAVVDRSIRDLRLLRTRLDGREFFAGGIPWYVALIGRDSLLAALLMLAYRPEMAADTLRLLAAYQGRRDDPARDEEPGKILHELRLGELARLGAIPQTPYYGAVDTTPLFLVLLARHAAWTGDLALFRELRDHVDAALEWIDRYGDRDGDGYIEYQRRAAGGLDNQGWKDSDDSMVHADGRRAEPPIAPAEAQGYVYLAKMLLADLFARAGERARADRLRREAEALRRRFDRDFWVEEAGTYALALDGAKRPLAVAASNAGHALWSGIAEAGKARRTIERLMAEDLFSGWGVRSLAASERAYNPLGYHLGTVWPHDNALIAAGCRRYGGDAAATRILAGLVAAARHFDAYRLPEVFAGFARSEYDVPGRYPDACHPQAWSAASVPYLVATVLGLEPEAFDRRLRVVRPTLPDGCERLELRRLRVGPAAADLRFRRADDGGARVEVVRVDGPLEVVVDPEATGA